MTTADTNESKERESLVEEQEVEPGAVEAGAEAAEAIETVDEAEDIRQDDEVEAKLEEWKKQAEDNHHRFLRVQADFDNFRRRTLREKEELAQFASLKLIEQLLPTVDNFERALLAGGEAKEKDTFQTGMEMIHRQLMQVLEAEGLRKMEAVGTPFDPEMHQAVMREETSEYEEGIVIDVIQNGYWLKDKVLRPAMVKVSG